LLAGAVGLPVFSGFRGGVGAFLAPDGGYLFGFVFAVIVSGYGIKHFGGGTFVMAASMAAGLVVCYILGTVWYLMMYAGNTGAAGFGAALSLCVVPYILPDAVKIFLAILLTKRLRAYVAL